MPQKTDQKTSIQQLKDKIEQFVSERDWQQFHTAKNLSMDIAAEAAELMEFFLWLDGEASNKEMNSNRDEIEQEVADIFFGILALCNRFNIDLSSVLERKIEITGQRYPVEKAKGRHTKYTKL